MLHCPPKASRLGFLSSFNINKKFQIDRVPHALHLKFGTLAGWWPVWANGAQRLKIGIFECIPINKKFLIDRVPSCPTFEIWDFGRIGE
jgi:hypothetical protein